MCCLVFYMTCYLQEQKTQKPAPTQPSTFILILVVFYFTCQCFPINNYLIKSTYNPNLG